MWLRPHKGVKVPTFDGGPKGAKPSDAEFAKFLDTALGSAYEVETQLTIAHNVDYINDDIFTQLMNRRTKQEQR